MPIAHILTLLVLMVGVASVTSVAAADAATAAAAAGPYTGMPCDGKPIAIPGTMLATHYDVAPGAADGIAFHYGSPAKAGGGRPGADAIGIGAIDGSHRMTAGGACDGGGYYLGWTQSGEWVRFTVEVAAAGVYQVGGRFAAGGTKTRISVASSTGGSTSFEVPTTAGFLPGVEVYHVWGDHPALGEITLAAGVQVITVTIDRADGLNVYRLTFLLGEPQQAEPRTARFPTNAPPALPPGTHRAEQSAKPNQFRIGSVRPRRFRLFLKRLRKW